MQHSDACSALEAAQKANGLAKELTSDPRQSQTDAHAATDAAKEAHAKGGAGAIKAHLLAAKAHEEASKGGWGEAANQHMIAARAHGEAATHLAGGDKGKADGAVPELKSAADKLEALEAKMNENHDEQGRFASGGEASSAAYMASSKADMARDKAIIIGTRGENEKAAILQRIAAQAHRTASSRLTKEYTINPSATKLAQAQSHEFAAMNHDSKAAYHDARAKGVPLPTHNLPISHARTNSF